MDQTYKGKRKRKRRRKESPAVIQQCPGSSFLFSRATPTSSQSIPPGSNSSVHRMETRHTVTESSADCSSGTQDANAEDASKTRRHKKAKNQKQRNENSNCKGITITHDSSNQHIGRQRGYTDRGDDINTYGSYQRGNRGHHRGRGRADHHTSGNRGGRSEGGEGSHRGGSQGSRYGGYCGKNRAGRGGERRPQATVTSQSQSEDGAGSTLEIPGFYYDPEKKRYFKIQDSASNVDGDFITKETIAKNKAESQRQKDLAALSEKTSARLTASSTVTERTLRKPVRDSVPSLLLNGYQRGEVNKFKLRKTWILGSASELRQTGKRQAFVIPDFHFNLEHMIQMEMSKDHDKLLCLWSLAESMVERMQLVSIKESERTRPGELALEFDSSDTTVLQSWNKITNVCWSELSQFPDKKYVLYTTRCHSSHNQSLAFIRNLDPATQDEVRFFDFNLGTQMTWTCAWNYHKQQFGVGTEKGCLLVDVNTRRLWQFKTNKSDALAQIFTKEDGGNTMYTGTRRGSILRHDLRSSSALPIHLMSHSTSVCCLRLSPEEQYLYASDFSGNIKKWDLRTKKVVLTYDGLFNKQSRLPFHIDETQSLLYGAGQDCYTKIWCLKTGKMLRSIPPPYEASLYSIPAVQFSSRWAGIEGNLGLIMGAHKNFYLYGPCSDSGGVEL
ncbi:DDB1- and CUL4-associated factor 4-like [Littorina saxatilis]|uniref:DDB1- and CUL4-associated factor 4-like n=1 Tax=Littorina saxatilis TaxID=31220 RepID=UPI0038B5EAA5